MCGALWKGVRRAGRPMFALYGPESKLCVLSLHIVQDARGFIDPLRRVHRSLKEMLKAGAKFWDLDSELW